MRESSRRGGGFLPANARDAFGQDVGERGDHGDGARRLGAQPAFKARTRPPITREMRFRRALPLLAACAAVALHRLRRATSSASIPPVRAATFTFDATVTPRDRKWILAAIDKVRPEARQLIDDVDGMITIGTFVEPGGDAVGLAQEVAPNAYRVTFNLAYLDGDRKADRDSDRRARARARDRLRARVRPSCAIELAGELPSSGACFTAESGDCTSPTERFADTFAKWALRGAVSAIGAGYSVLPPASLEDWGAPLSTLAIEIAVASR